MKISPLIGTNANRARWLEANGDLIQLFQSSSVTLMRMAIAGSARVLPVLRARQRHHRHWIRPRSSGSMPLASFRYRDKLQKVGARLSPVPRPPGLLTKELPETAAQVLLMLYPYDSVRHVLARARFCRGDLRFKTEWRRGRPVIFGENGRKIWHLAGLAHELGHALAEQRQPPKVFSDYVVSETMALCLEQITVSRALRSSEDLADWTRYQWVNDQLNFYFNKWESSRDRGFSPVDFDPYLLCFRETLFTSAGYQRIYAEASQLRSRVLFEMQHLGPVSQLG